MSPKTDASEVRRLEDNTGVIFGAGGEVGSPVAKDLAAQGARAFLSSRMKAPVQDLAEAISTHGETAAAAVHLCSLCREAFRERGVGRHRLPDGDSFAGAVEHGGDRSGLRRDGVHDEVLGH
jgi:NAD(P)-dependent dehydrogenase (short-subunit alcohol dehydrogenase family)